MLLVQLTRVLTLRRQILALDLAPRKTCRTPLQGQLTEAAAQRLFLQLLTALEFRRTMGASQDFLVDDVLLATSPPAAREGDGLPTIKT